MVQPASERRRVLAPNPNPKAERMGDEDRRSVLCKSQPRWKKTDGKATMLQSHDAADG